MKTANHQEEETSSSAQRFKVAVVQATPVVFDRERTIERVHALSTEAARKSARLVLFPEVVGGSYSGTLGGEPDLETELARAKSGKFGVGFITWALERAPKVLKKP